MLLDIRGFTELVQMVTDRAERKEFHIGNAATD
jgi:hypothetical protein